jgi:hypothetical protein
VIRNDCGVFKKAPELGSDDEGSEEVGKAETPQVREDIHVKHVGHANTDNAEPQLPTRVPHFLAFEHIFLVGSFVALVVSNISSYEIDDYGNTDTKDEDLDRS